MTQIEKNVPMPALRQKYNWSKMEIGDSIFSERHLGATAYSWSQHNGGKKKFVTREAEKYFDARTNMELSEKVAEQMKKNPSLKKHLVIQKGFRTWRVE